MSINVTLSPVISRRMFFSLPNVVRHDSCVRMDYALMFCMRPQKLRTENERVLDYRRPEARSSSIWRGQHDVPDGSLGRFSLVSDRQEDRPR